MIPDCLEALFLEEYGLATITLSLWNKDLVWPEFQLRAY
jgi:hypothetical protein